MEIDSIEVVRAIKRRWNEMSTLAPWRHPDTSLEELKNWLIVVADAFARDCVDVGYFKTTSHFLQSQGVRDYENMVKDFEQKVIGKEEFGNWCKAKDMAMTAIVDGITRCHQQDFGLVEEGYKVSPKLEAGRKALAEYQESQRGVDPYAHAPLWDKFKETIIGLGWTVEDFLEINEVLP